MNQKLLPADILALLAKTPDDYGIPGPIWTLAKLVTAVQITYGQHYTKPGIQRVLIAEGWEYGEIAGWTKTTPTLLTRSEAGELIFQKIKTHVESLEHPDGGHCYLSSARFPADFPISLRAIWNIRKGHFDIKVFDRLDFLKVKEFFTVE